MSSSGLRRLLSASMVYGLGSVLSRSLTFLLLPVYTRSLSAADYGVVAVALTVSSVLGVLLPLGLHGAVARLHYATADEADRRRTNATLWLTVLGCGLVLALLADTLGAPLAAWLLPQVPFHPYLRLAIWSAFFTSLSLVPLAMLQVQERSRTYVALTLGSSLATSAAVILFVVIRSGGARGYLQGTLLGAVLASVAYVLLSFRAAPPALERNRLREALQYSLPLVPHALATWVLELSDRVVLARYVPLAEVGVYGIGYQLGAALGMLTGAFTNAWVPILFDGLSKGDDESRRRLARLETYYVVALTFCALGGALLAQPAIAFLLAPAYHVAYPVTVWVLAAYVMNGLYILPIGLVFWKKATWLVPVVTVMAGGSNVLLNVLLLPRFGYMAAAWSTFACYGVMLVLAYVLARTQQPFPYEYRRLGGAVLVAAVLYGFGSTIAPGTSLYGTVLRIAVWATFVPCVMLIGVVDRHELGQLRAVLLRRLPLPASRSAQGEP